MCDGDQKFFGWQIFMFELAMGAFIYTWTLLCGQQNIAWKLQSVPANTVPLHVTGTSASTRLTTCHMNQWTGSCFLWGCSSLTFPFEGYRIIQNTNWIVYFFKIIYCGDKWFSGGQIVQFLPLSPLGWRGIVVTVWAGGRLGGRLPNLRNPYLCNRLMDFLRSKFYGIV